MWPAAASTATPSGRRRPVTMTCRSEPSGAMVKIRPSLRLRTTRRSVTPSMVVVIGNSVERDQAARRCLEATTPRHLIPLNGVSNRSEEHTSELQSHSDLVCRLLLEKKKKNKKFI